MSVEEKIYNFLKQVRSEKPECYEQVKRILGYIYKIVKKDFFEKVVSDYKKTGDVETGKTIKSFEQYIFSEYVEGENGLLDNLISIVNNNPQAFKYFYQEIEAFLEMADNGIYSKYAIHNYLFNMYTILRYYYSNPNDFEGFKVVIADLSSFFIEPGLFNNEYYTSYEKKKNIIDKLLTMPDYKNKTRIRRELKKILSDISYIYEDSLPKAYEIMIADLINFYVEIDKIQNQGLVVLPKVIDELEEEIMKNITKTEKNNGWSKSYKKAGSRKILYTPILLLGERLNFIKERLLEVEAMQSIRENIMEYITQMNPNFFDYLNHINPQKDSFMSCMNIVLDSDTYYEVDSKLKALIKASKIYNTNEKDALQIVADLSSNKHKEVIDGVVMAWPEDDCINKVGKPKTILERMIKLHTALKNAPDKEFYLTCSSSCYIGLTLNDFTARVLKEMQQIKEAELEKKRQEENQQKLLEESKKQKGLGSIFSRKNNS